MRYKKVVHQCALERDFTLFDAGDATEVGEKGLTLSGGQKARITLARAVYSPANILLLDDILSASVSVILLSCSGKVAAYLAPPPPPPHASS